MNLRPKIRPAELPLPKLSLDVLAPVPDPALLEGTGWNINQYEDDQARRIRFRRSDLLQEHAVDETVFERALELEQQPALYSAVVALLKDERFQRLKEQLAQIRNEETAVFRDWMARRLLCTRCKTRPADFRYWSFDKGNSCEECHLTRPSTPPAKGIASALSRARQAKVSATLSKKQWQQTTAHFNDRCAYCRGAWSLVEHATPLPRGGTTMDNCLPACTSCNMQKKGLSIEDLEPNACVIEALAWLRSCGRPA